MLHLVTCSLIASIYAGAMLFWCFVAGVILADITFRWLAKMHFRKLVRWIR